MYLTKRFRVSQTNRVKTKKYNDYNILYIYYYKILSSTTNIPSRRMRPISYLGPIGGRRGEKKYNSHTTYNIILYIYM